MSDVGTWAWAQRTGGAMGRRDRLDQLCQGILARLAALPMPLRRSVLGSDGPLDLPDRSAFLLGFAALVTGNPLDRPADPTANR